MSDDLVFVAAKPRFQESSIEYTFWFQLDGTVPIEAVSRMILQTLSEASIPGVVNSEFRSPFAKEYEQ